MKVFIEQKDTVIEYGMMPIDNKGIECICEHKGIINRIYYHEDIYNNHGIVIGCKKIELYYPHLLEIMKKCEEILSLRQDIKYEPDFF